MKSPYELKALGQAIVDEAKKDGLVVAEEALEKLGKAVYAGTKTWLKESAKMSTDGILGKADDFVVPFVDKLDVYVNPQIEKIDLNDDGK
jgi:hypothetical protein